MLSLVVRRAWVQRRLLSGVVLLVAVAATLMGFYALLLGVTGPKSFTEQVQRSQPDDVDVTAYVVGVRGADAEAARQSASHVVRHVLAPLHPQLVSTTTSQMRQIGETGGLGYLATTDSRAGLGALTSGRWPADATHGPVEALAPDAAAGALGLHLGDRLRLGPGPGLGESQRRATVVIVGTFRGLPRAAAQSDPLSGAGFDPSFSKYGSTAPAYGPFLVGHAAFLSTGFDVEGMRVDGLPDLSTADDAGLRQAVASLGSASALLSARVGSSADITRVGSQLPETLDALHAQEETTRSAVLVALLLDTVLGLAALVLAGRVLADTRADERELLTTLGLSPGQQLAASLVEGLLLALAAAIGAVPTAAVLYGAVTHLPALRAARLAEAPTVTAGLVGTVLAGAAVLVLVLVASPVVGAESGRSSSRRRALGRSSVDLLLLVVAAAGWWQLRSRPSTGGGGDTLLVLAPVLCLAAVTMLAVRCLPPLFTLAAAAGRRSRALLPASLDPVSLGLSSGTALVLLSLAAASATFGLAVHATWHRSQDDQADLRVGTDLSLTLDAPPTAGDAAAIARTASAGTRDAPASPVTTRPVALGHYFGDLGEPPQLVALDTRQAGSLLHGRLAGGETWSDIGRRLAPGPPVRGIALPSGAAGVTVVGHAPAGTAVSVTPGVVVQDPSGFRSTLTAAAVPVDGRPHAVRWSSPPAPGQSIIAVHLSYTGASSGPASRSDVAVSVELRVRAPRGGPADVRIAPWQTEPPGASDVVISPSVSVHRTDTATVLALQAHMKTSELQYGDGEVLATAFAPPTSVPVAVSQTLVDATGVRVGGELSATIVDSVLLLHVVQVVPTVPSEPGRIAVLADVDSVSRALIATGHLEPTIDAFWVAHPTTATAAALDRLRLGTVTTRAQVTSELARGPLQVTLPVAYLTVTASAVLLLLVGAVLVVSSDQRRRSSGVARLRALGLSRRGARLLLFGQHGALLVALVVTGVLVGGAGAAALDRSLVRSDRGTTPVPSAVLAWPWVTEAALACGLVVACLVVAALASAMQVRASDTSRLRTDDAR